MDMGDIKWLGQSGFAINAGGTSIVVDPFKIPDIGIRADILMITHPHFDHFSKDDIAKVVKKGTRIICSKGCDGIEAFGTPTVVTPGFASEVKGVKISAVPAYNVNSSRLQYHPRANEWVGYVIEHAGKRIYHAGDTDFIEEMKSLNGLSLALLPVGGTYTMDVDEGISAAMAIDAELVAPMHYRMLLGEDMSRALEKKFSGALANALILKEAR